MSAIQPKGEGRRRAVRWLSAHRRYSAEAIAEASRRFDLSPSDEEFLLRNFLHADTDPVRKDSKAPPERTDKTRKSK